ncbi:hypothetical protein BDZ91DRAFT_753291 [Kalaharituber pfeilii]|nr:hypothetical protein BDZ91DRAFT_753291 [Kalaharituber pfeilii]
MPQMEPQIEPQILPQDPLSTYHLSNILSQASAHPTYKPLLRDDTFQAPLTLQSFDFANKDHLLRTFDYLIRNQPSFLHSTYISPTGGTHSSATTHLYFFTSTTENRAQRKLASTLLSTINVFEPTDIVVNLHGGVPMYRSQDLTGTLIDHCGATELSVGASAQDVEVIWIAKQFKANVVTATSTRLLQLARYVQGLTRQNSGAEMKVEEQVGLKLEKAVFTSEPLSKKQERFLKETLGVETVASVFGCAEAGPWAGSPPLPVVGYNREAGEDSVGRQSDLPGSGIMRMFIFDKRQIVVEIIDDDGNVLDDSTRLRLKARAGKSLIGEIVLTSLTRFRNPLVRYRSGDLGSLHDISSVQYVQDLLKRKPETDVRFLCGLTLYGRSTKSSFFAQSDYIEVNELDQRIFNKPEWDVLEWQVIIYVPNTDEEEGKVTFESEVEILDPEGYEKKLAQEIIAKVVPVGIKVVVKEVDYKGLERGRMAGKVKKIVDRRV